MQLQDLIEKKIFIIGPPGSKVRELALSLAEHFKFGFVSVGDLLIKELSKKSTLVNIDSKDRVNK